MIGGFLLVLFAFIYTDLMYKNERRKRYEKLEEYCAKKKIDGTLEYKRAIKERYKIINDIRKGMSLDSICVKYGVSECGDINKIALQVSRRQMKEEGYFPCLPDDFPLDIDRGLLPVLIKQRESFADKIYILCFKDKE